jgi:hypothetical protein
MNVDEGVLIEMVAERMAKDATFRANVAAAAARLLLDSTRAPTTMDVVEQIKERIAELTRERAEEIGRAVARSLDHRVTQKVENVLTTWSEKSIRNILAETVRRVAYDVLAKRLRPHLDAAVQVLLTAAQATPDEDTQGGKS